MLVIRLVVDAKITSSNVKIFNQGINNPAMKAVCCYL